MKYNHLELGTIEAIVNRLGGMEGVSDFLSGKTLLRPRKFAFQTWKTIKLGLYNDKDTYVKALKEAGFGINDFVFTSSVIENTTFVVAREGTEIELVKLSVEELLCHNDGASYTEILKSAKSQGLCECPIEVVFALMLQHIQESEYQQLEIATEPTVDCKGRPSIFEIDRKTLSKKTTNDSNFSYAFEFVFCRQKI